MAVERPAKYRVEIQQVGMATRGGASSFNQVATIHSTAVVSTWLSRLITIIALWSTSGSLRFQHGLDTETARTCISASTNWEGCRPLLDETNTHTAEPRSRSSSDAAMDDDSFWGTLALPDPNREADLLKPLPEEILAPTSPVTRAEDPISYPADVSVPEPDKFELGTELNTIDTDLIDINPKEHVAKHRATPLPSTPKNRHIAPLDSNTLIVSPAGEGLFADILNAEDFNIDYFGLSTYGPLTPEPSSPAASASDPFHLESSPEPIFAEDHELPDESFEEYRTYLTDMFCKMMFVSGETAEASAETTWLIEEIVREQVVHMLKVATEYANRRGHKSITVADLIFQIRHDKSKVSRLKTFLSWKDVRKNVKDSDDKGGGDAGDIDLEADGAQAPAAGGPAPKANKKQKLVLPWDVESYYAVQVPERDDEEDEEEDEQNEATLARLASADERTRNMTREEYVYWSDCRQASFTFRKGKRFREWAGFGTIVDAKPNDDVIDILGFLTFEIVQTLTETALRVKAEKDFANRKNAKGQGEKKRKREECSLFSMTEEGRTPVEPEHVREAFRRLQIPPKKATFFQTGWTGMRRPYRLI